MSSKSSFHHTEVFKENKNEKEIGYFITLGANKYFVESN